MRMDRTVLEAYLADMTAAPVHVSAITTLGGAGGAAAIKAFGYGKPLRIAYRTGKDSGVERSVVLRQISRNGFGRERDSDRVAEVWLDYTSFNTLDRHVAAIDMIGLTNDDRLVSLGDLHDLLLLTAYVPGQPYADDLLRIRDQRSATDGDYARAVALARYAAAIHQVRHDDPLLWRRRLRDLIGHGEGIMGLTDSYPADFALARADDLEAIEVAANRWRWRLKPLAHRLAQVHGDFHPFNVLFTDGVAFSVIDRSRGAWGEPADDVSCMSINYLFFSLQRCGTFVAPFTDLYHAFWGEYLQCRPDVELVRVIQPWLAWRALVLASPQWYPTLSDEARRAILRLARAVLATDVFDWQHIERYLGTES